MLPPYSFASQAGTRPGALVPAPAIQNERKGNHMDDATKAYFSPMPKMSMAQKGRKTIGYLQKCKDEGKKIVQHCPSMLGPMFTMAAAMADVDIVRLSPSELRYGADEALRDSDVYLAGYRQMSPYIHINYVTDTIAFAEKSEALKNFSKFHQAGADSVLPMGVNNETLKFVTDNHCIVYGHVGALSGWQTNGLYGGYRKLGKTAEDALKIYKQAYEYQENGMGAMSVELVPGEVSATIAKKMRVPVIGIASGCTGGEVDVDGYEMVDADLFGLMAKPAMHAKTYANFLEFATGVYGAWTNDVRTNAYPAENNGWHMDEAELAKFTDAVEQL